MLSLTFWSDAMLTVILFLAAILCFVLFFKSIDFFEKIWCHDRFIYSVTAGFLLYGLRFDQTGKILVLTPTYAKASVGRPTLSKVERGRVFSFKSIQKWIQNYWESSSLLLSRSLLCGSVVSRLNKNIALFLQLNSKSQVTFDTRLNRCSW